MPDDRRRAVIVRTIAIINQKGGSGKTTTAINLAAALARRDRRVLLVDADPQSHCALGLAVPESRIDLSLADAMLAPAHRPAERARLVWHACRGLDLIPSTVRLASLEAPGGGLADRSDRDRRLAAALDHLRADYDWCFIDCPPSIGLLTFNALRVADEVLIPVETAYFALEGAMRQVNTIRALGRRLGVQVPYRVLATLHRLESALAGDVLSELERRFAPRLLPVVIRFDERLRESASAGMTIHQFDPDAAGAADYNDLAHFYDATRYPSAEPPHHPLHIHANTPGAAHPRRAMQPTLQPVEVEPPSSKPPNLLSRAAELAARARQLSVRNQELSRRLEADPRVARVLRELEAEHAAAGPAGTTADDHPPSPFPA